MHKTKCVFLDNHGRPSVRSVTRVRSGGNRPTCLAEDEKVDELVEKIMKSIDFSSIDLCLS